MRGVMKNCGSVGLLVACLVGGNALTARAGNAGGTGGFDGAGQRQQHAGQAGRETNL